MANNVADLVIVDAALHGDNEGGRYAMPLEILQRLLAYFSQIGAAEIDQRLAFERVELQIDLEAALVFREPRHEIRLARDSKPVGVDHDMANRAGAYRGENCEEIRVQRRLAAR